MLSLLLLVIILTQNLELHSTAVMLTALQKWLPAAAVMRHSIHGASTPYCAVPCLSLSDLQNMAHIPTKQLESLPTARNLVTAKGCVGCRSVLTEGRRGGRWQLNLGPGFSLCRCPAEPFSRARSQWRPCSVAASPGVPAPLLG